MEKALNTAHNLLLSDLKQDKSFDLDKVTTSFWGSFTKALLDFETDAKPIYTLIYSLELNNAGAIISTLPNIYKSFISELAEGYVLGETSAETKYIIEKNNPTFQDQIIFFKTLENVIKKAERQRIKSELPNLYNKLTFDIPEATIEALVKKKSREDLKKKFQKWNDELVEEEIGSVVQLTPAKSLESKKETKVISLSWIKYAVAALVVISAGIFYFIPFDNKLEPQIVNGFIQKNNTPILSPVGIGFADKSSLDSLDITNIIRKNGDYQNTKITYKYLDKKLTIFGDSLLLKSDAFPYKILTTSGNKMYLARNNMYYPIIETKKESVLEKETDKTIIEELEKISFDND